MQQFEKMPSDEKIAFDFRLSSESGLEVRAKLFERPACTASERPHHVAEILTPARLRHGVLESHFVDLLGGGDARQFCEHSPERVTWNLQKTVYSIVTRLKLNPRKFRDGPHQLITITFDKRLALRGVAPTSEDKDRN